MGKPCDTCTSRTDTACDKRPTSGDSCAGYTNAPCGTCKRAPCACDSKLSASTPAGQGAMILVLQHLPAFPPPSFEDWDRLKDCCAQLILDDRRYYTLADKARGWRKALRSMAEIVGKYNVPLGRRSPQHQGGEGAGMTTWPPLNVRPVAVALEAAR